MERDKVLLQAFASELKARRGKLGLSQEEVAHQSEVNRTYIAKLELARNQPTLFVLFKISVALKVGLPELMQATVDRYQVEQASQAKSARKG